MMIEPMKALTVRQPYASLLAILAKLYETRGWATSYRGRIAIHAGTNDCAGMMSSEQINACICAFAGTRYEVPHNRPGGGCDYIYPYGAVIATAELIGCHRIYGPDDSTLNATFVRTKAFQSDYTIIESNELLFGDWTPGRYAWEFANMTLLPVPIPARGQQGLWNWEGVV